MSSLFNKWKAGLSKTSKATFGQIVNLLGASEITDDTYEELEALLIKADLGVDTSEAILETLWQRERSEGLTKANQLKEVLEVELRSRLSEPPAITFSTKPTIILVVGVNGSGKTTSIAKLGKRSSDQGFRVILGAADTFRAAAVDQLQIWGERVDLPVIAGQPHGPMSLTAVVVSLPLTSPLYAQDPKPTVSHYAGPREDAPIPRPGLTPKKGRVAVVVTDPQNDFLSPKGVAWGVVGQSVQENHTV